jgi:hypothetical protein
MQREAERLGLLLPQELLEDAEAVPAEVAHAEALPAEAKPVLQEELLP